MTVQESVLRIQIDSRNAERNARALNEEIRSIERNGDFASNSMDAMSVASRRLATSLAGIVTVGAAISKIDAYTSLQNRLKLVTNNQQELNQAMQATFQIAQGAGQAWDSVAQVYQRFADNAKTLGITMEQTASLTDTVAKAISVSGGSAASAEAALVQFGQALASGVLRGEEFNSIAEQAPALLKAIATGLGTTIGPLRAMAAEGKLTGDVVISALEKAKVSVDDLFSKTDFTIANSFTQLNNAVTQFVGEAGQANGSAQLLSSTIKTLADNLNLIADVAILGGVALLTKAVVTQTVAVRASIAATIQRRSAEAALLQEQVTLAALELQRTRQVQALALTEVSLARAEFNSATTRAQRAAATIRLTQAEIAYNLAVRQTTIALSAQTAAQTAANATMSIGARALGLIGGPIGAITLGVTALAAGYMYFEARTGEANQKLEEQAAVAKKTKEELLALEGAQKSSAKTDLATAFEAQNKELEKSSQLIGNLIAEIYSKNTADAETAKILKEVRQGTMTYDDAFKALNKSKADMPDIINRLRDEIDNYELGRQKAQENANAQETLGAKVTLAGNAAQNAVGKINDNSGALDGNAASARNAANAQSEYMKSLQASATQTATVNKLIEKGFSPERAQALSEAYFKNNQKLSAEDVKLVDFNLSQNAKLKSSIDAISSAKKTSAKASKDANTQAKKDAQEAKKLAEQQAKESLELSEQYYYAYADREKQIEMNLTKEIIEIKKARFENESYYIDRAKNRANIEKKLYQAQVDYEVNEYKMGEDEKIKAKHTIDQYKLALDQQYNAKNLSALQASLKKQAEIELANAKLAKEQRLFQAEQGMYTEMGLIQKRYELELQEIAKVVDAEERARLQIAAAETKKKDESDLQISTTIAYNAAIGVDDSADRALIERQNAIDAMYENGFIKQQEYELRSKQSREQYNLDMINLQLSQGEAVSGALASMFSSMLGESSSAYRALFAVQKAFALSQAGMNLWKSASDAYAAAQGTVWNKIAEAGRATLDQGTFIAMINAATPKGFKTGGYTGNTGTSSVAGVVHGQEYVLNAQATKRIGTDTLDAMNSGATIGDSSVTVNVYVTPTSTTTTATSSDTSDQQQLGNLIGNAVRKVIMQEQRQGGLLSK